MNRTKSDSNLYLQGFFRNIFGFVVVNVRSLSRDYPRYLTPNYKFVYERRLYPSHTAAYDHIRSCVLSELEFPFKFSDIRDASSTGNFLLNVYRLQNKNTSLRVAVRSHLFRTLLIYMISISLPLLVLGFLHYSFSGADLV